MNVELSPRWESTDIDTFLVFNHTAPRHQIQARKDGVPVKNNTITGLHDSEATENEVASHVHYNYTHQQQIHVAFNGKGGKLVNFVSRACVWDCNKILEETKCETNPRYWSKAGTWASTLGHVPVEGDEVIIPGTWNLVFDVESTPLLAFVENRGCLTWQDKGPDVTRYMHTHHFFNKGRVTIGTDLTPFTGLAFIKLYGDRESQYKQFGGSIEVGNKVLANSGYMKMVGEPRPHRSRLTQTTDGTNIIHVENLDTL